MRTFRLTLIFTLTLTFVNGVALASSERLWQEIPPSASTACRANAEVEGRQAHIDEQVADADRVGLILMGDSITHYWETGDKYRTTYNALTADRHAVNLAVTGDVTPGMIYRLEQRGHLDFKDGVTPKVAMLLCGTNNLHRRMLDLKGRDSDPQEVADGIRAIIQIFVRRYPSVRVLNLAVFPTRWHQGWRPTNDITRDYADGRQVLALNLEELFLNEDGSVNKDLMPDGIHPNAAGYRAWLDAMDPVIEELMKAEPLDPVTIMPLGGSITEGRSSATCYRRYLDGMLRRAGHMIDFVGSRAGHDNNRAKPDSYQYDYDHEGHWGKTSGWMAEHIGELAAENAPDIAVLHMGTEDLLAGSGPTERVIENAAANIGRTIAALRAANGQVKIVLAQIIPTRSVDVAHPDAAVRAMNAAITKLAAETSTVTSPVVLVDQYSGFDPRRDLSEDGVRPNAAGARKMAGRFCSVIDDLIDGRRGRTEAHAERESVIVSGE